MPRSFRAPHGGSETGIPDGLIHRHPMTVRWGKKGAARQYHSLLWGLTVCGVIIAGCATIQRPLVTASCPPIRSEYGDSLDVDRAPRRTPHTGIDIVADLGHPVLAAADGTVLVAGDRVDVGLNVVIDHGTGANGRRVYTFYGHLSRVGVHPGQQVSRGTVIGGVGDTGTLMPRSRQSHLHFEVLTGDGPPRIRYDASSRPSYISRTRGASEEPHDFWILENNYIAPFLNGRVYSTEPIRFTYPVPCTP